MLQRYSLALALMCACGAALAAAAETEPQKIDCYDSRKSKVAGDVEEDVASSPLYQFEFPEVVGGDAVKLEQYRGHVLLLVNVATY